MKIKTGILIFRLFFLGSLAGAEAANGTTVAGNGTAGNGTDTYGNGTTSAPAAAEACNGNLTNGVCLSKSQSAVRCDTGVLTGSKFTTVKILCIFALVWIIIWCIITIIINVLHKNKGHHRFIHLYEEIFIILLYICIGLNLLFRGNKSTCQIVSVLCHYFMVLLSAAFVMESLFAHSMTHGKSKKNGNVPVVLNYIVPILIALIPTLFTFLFEKEFYGASGLHCFASVPNPPFYGFVIPVWLLLLFAGLKSSLGNLACDMTEEGHQDFEQVYWCKKSAKCLMFFSYFLMMIWLTCLLASSQQRLWIFLLFFLQSLIFGPMIFIYHTYCHRNSAMKLRTKFFGSFYKMCEYTEPGEIPRCTKNHEPPKEKPPKEKPKKDEPVPADSPPTAPSAQAPPAPVNEPPAEAPPPPQQPPFRAPPPPQQLYEPVNEPRSRARDTHGASGDYYDWLSDSKQGGDGKHVLFRK